MYKITVDLKDNPYPIYIGQRLLHDSQLFQSLIKADSVVIISNSTVAPLYLNTLKTSLAAYEIDEFIIPDGEKYKSFETLSSIFEFLLSKNCPRTTTLIALGGGVIGDITGFAAACYMRGIQYIQVPTTLLAQVDASIGGKTAINHRLAKNMIGAFHQPQGVIIDTTTLNSLPLRQLRAGLAEIIKYALIKDGDFFEWLYSHITKVIALENESLSYAIKLSSEIKADIICQDEKEKGLRAILNFGHTIAHAIEAYYGYEKWLHGEAVAVGMVVAAKISNQLGLLAKEKVTLIQQLCNMADLPTHLPFECKWVDLKEFVVRDKKVVDNRVKWIVINDIGSALSNQAVPEELIEQALIA